MYNYSTRFQFYIIKCSAKIVKSLGEQTPWLGQTFINAEKFTPLDALKIHSLRFFALNEPRKWKYCHITDIDRGYIEKFGTK